MDRKQFGKLVAALRKEHYDENGDRYTQAKLAEIIAAEDSRTPLNEIVIGKIERGERTILDDQTLLNLADALKLTIGERRVFFLLATGLEHTQIYPVEAEGEAILASVVEMLGDIRLPSLLLDRYLDVLAFRVFDHANLVGIAASSDAPVVNLLSDRSHPCQALADLQTVAEHRRLPGTVLTFVGDGNNVCHSLMLGGAMSGMHIRVAAPAGYEPSAITTAEATEIAAVTGGSILVTNNPIEGVAGTDVVYTDVWTSMGQEAEAAARLALFRPFQVNEALFAEAADDAIFLHCLPAHRDEELTHEVIEHERSFVFDQAENRMHAFKALLLYLTGTGD